MNYCKKCVYPIIAVNLQINSDGICSACKATELFNKINDDEWQIRKKKIWKNSRKRQTEQQKQLQLWLRNSC